jgi:hypothetical protein
MRTILSSSSGEPTLLQRGVPEGGADMVALEGAAEISGDEVWQSKTDRPKPAVSRARQKPQTTRA